MPTIDRAPVTIADWATGIIGLADLGTYVDDIATDHAAGGWARVASHAQWRAVASAKYAATLRTEIRCGVPGRYDLLDRPAIDHAEQAARQWALISRAARTEHDAGR